MNNEYSKYCKNIFTSELKKEKLNNVKKRKLVNQNNLNQR